MRDEYRLPRVLLSSGIPKSQILIDKGTPPFRWCVPLSSGGGGFPRRNVVDVCRVETCLRFVFESSLGTSTLNFSILIHAPVASPWLMVWSRQICFSFGVPAYAGSGPLV